VRALVKDMKVSVGYSMEQCVHLQTSSPLQPDCQV
jgi:hypothetical protein